MQTTNNTSENMTGKQIVEMLGEARALCSGKYATNESRVRGLELMSRVREQLAKRGS